MMDKISARHPVHPVNPAKHSSRIAINRSKRPMALTLAGKFNDKPEDIAIGHSNYDRLLARCQTKINQPTAMFTSVSVVDEVLAP